MTKKSLYEETYQKYDGRYGALVEEHVRTLQERKKAFEAALKRNECPFCTTTLKHYDGALGYEAMKCECGLTVDHSGIHLE